MSHARPVTRRRIRPPTAGARRRAAHMMLTMSAIGVLVAFLGTMTGWIVIGQLNQSTRSAIGVSIESLDAVDDTITLASGVLDSTIATVETVESTLDTLAGSVDQGTDVINSVTELSDSAGPALAEAESTLRDLEQIGGTIDSLLDTLGRLPLGLSYDPQARFGTTMGELADDIAPLSGAFSDTSTTLDSFSGGSTDLQTEINELAASVSTINGRLAKSPALVDQYRSNVANARQVAVETQDELASNLALTRVLIVLFGITFAAGQLVPFWYGRELLLVDSDAASQKPSGREALLSGGEHRNTV